MPATPYRRRKKSGRGRKAINPYDVFIIGSGPGGYTAAILAAKKGLRVGIADIQATVVMWDYLDDYPARFDNEFHRLFGVEPERAP